MLQNVNMRGERIATELLSPRLWLSMSRSRVALNILAMNADVDRAGDQDLSRMTDSLKTLPTSGRATVIHKSARAKKRPVVQTL